MMADSKHPGDSNIAQDPPPSAPGGPGAENPGDAALGSGTTAGTGGAPPTAAGGPGIGVTDQGRQRQVAVLQSVQDRVQVLPPAMAEQEQAT